MTTIFMTNEFTGETKAVPSGFSWTTLFFGFFVPLFRGDMAWAAIMLVANLFTWGLANIAFAFFYNGVYRDKLLERGFRVAGGMGGGARSRFEPVPPQHIIQQVYVNAGPDGRFTTANGMPPFQQPPFPPSPDQPGYHQPDYAQGAYNQPPERDFYHEPIITPAPPPPPPVIENRLPPRPSFGKRGL